MSPQAKDNEKGEVLSGYVEKKNRLGSWNKRYFVLLHGDFFLSYYPDDKKDRGPDGERGGYVDLRHCNLIQLDGKIITLHLHDKTKYRLRFGQVSEAKKWRNALYAVSIRVHSESETLRPLPTKPPTATLNPVELFPDVKTSPRDMSVRDEMSLERPQPESLGFYLLLRIWLGVALISIASSCVAIIPVPSLDLWFFKIFVLSGVFHATFLTLVSLAAVLSAVVVNTGKLRRSKRPSLCAGALGCFMVSGGIAAFPAVVNIPLAAHLPVRVDDFLSASNLSFAANPRVKALDLAEFLVDPPCALANVWEYYEHTHEIVYKQIPESTVEKTGLTIEDWSGFGGLSKRENEHGLRLAIFGTHPKNNLDIPTDSPLKPVVLSLHGGGWYRGSLYDGLQCYLPAALASGAAVVAAEYRSGADGWSGRDMVGDAMDAIEWIMEHGAAHGLDTTKLVVMGGSAGAHVGITAAYLLNKRHQRELVRGVVARYGAIGDLAAAHSNPSALPQGLGGGSGWSERVALEHITRGTPVEVPEEYAYLSPITHVDRHSPPTVMLHCRQDEFYDLQTHAVALSDALAAANRPHLLIAPHLHGHGCDIGSTAPFQLLRFALVHLLDALKREDTPVPPSTQEPPIVPIREESEQETQPSAANATSSEEL